MPSPDVVRVCVLGAESTGKTTLAQALAARYDTVWNPEYGRVYTEVGRRSGAPWESWEFAHIARVHCWYEDFVAGLARRVLFCDTDAFTTAVFHEAYLGTPATGFEELAARRYDLYVVCGIDVPFTHDGWREFEAQRLWMHERLLDHARESGSPWVLVEGPQEARVAGAAETVDALLTD
jgi:NadR type nicotinamide-nucleotide adenylyltransferase